jgi:hypothetical protein
MLSIYIAWPIAGLTWTAFIAEKLYDEVTAFRTGSADGPR